MSDDIEAMKEDYLDSLSELTFNSKPIIDNLTVIAGENKELAQGIVKAIEEHLSKCNLAYKLPVLYVIDSICKNIGNPYNQYFGINLYKIFTMTYQQNSEPVRRRMVQLFETWKRPLANGQTLFSNEQLKKISGFLEKVKSNQHQQQEEQRRKQAEHANQFEANGPMSANALLSEVDKLISLTMERKKFDPSPDADEQLGVLGQLKQLLSTRAVDAQSLPAIQRQLATFNRNEMERLEQITRKNTPPVVPAVTAANPAQALAGIDFSKLRFNTPTPTPPASSSFSSAPVSAPAPNTLDILNTLKQRGFGNSPKPALVELNNQALNKPRPELIDRLYKNLSEQCGACGRRFTNNDQGQREKTAHLDWHFRTNKRLREDQRQVNRCYYQSLDEWIAYKDEDEVIGLDSDKPKEKKKDAPVELSREELMAKYIEAPSSTSALAKMPCRVCKEKFSTQWSDKAEQWVWANAVKVGSRIYHATCYAEAEHELKSAPVAPPPPVANTNTGTGKPLDNQSAAKLANIFASFNKRKREPSTDEDGEKKVKIEP